VTVPWYREQELTALSGYLLDYCVRMRARADAPVRQTADEVAVAGEFSDPEAVQVCLWRLHRREDELVERGDSDEEWVLGG
jgi:hypothetical protein